MKPPSNCIQYIRSSLVSQVLFRRRILIDLTLGEEAVVTVIDEHVTPLIPPEEPVFVLYTLDSPEILGLYYYSQQLCLIQWERVIAVSQKLHREKAMAVSHCYLFYFIWVVKDRNFMFNWIHVRTVASDYVTLYITDALLMLSMYTRDTVTLLLFY